MRACRIVATLSVAIVSFVAPAAQERGTIAGRIITPDGVAAADVEVFVRGAASRLRPSLERAAPGTAATKSPDCRPGRSSLALTPSVAW